MSVCWCEPHAHHDSKSYFRGPMWADPGWSRLMEAESLGNFFERERNSWRNTNMTIMP